MAIFNNQQQSGGGSVPSYESDTEDTSLCGSGAAAGIILALSCTLMPLRRRRD